MTLRISLLLSLLLLVAGLLLLSCAKQDTSTATAIAQRGGGPSWPPDTMAFTIIGSGRLSVVASWKPLGTEAGARRLTVFETAGVTTRPEIGGGAAMKMRMVPDTAAEMLQHIIERPRTTASPAALILTSWPSDTTKK